MLTAIHNLLRAVVLDRGRIAAEDVDISFETPSRAWIDGLTRPTLDFALIDMQENLKLREASPQTTRSNGHAAIRMPARRLDLRYMVTALTSDADDSHRLLWRAMVTLMRMPELPTDLLPEEVRRQLQVPLLLRVAQVDAEINVLDVWSATGADMRPAFGCVVTVPVDLDTLFMVPLVFQKTTNYTQRESLASAGTFVDIGGVVRDHAGQAVANARVAVAGTAIGAVADLEGRYVVHRLSPGPIVLQVARPNGPIRDVAIEIPSAFYDLRVD